MRATNRAKPALTPAMKAHDGAITERDAEEGGVLLVLTPSNTNAANHS